MHYLDIKFPWYKNGIKTVVPSGEISLKQFIEAIKNPKDSVKKAFLDIQAAANAGDIKLKDELKQRHLFFTTPSIKTQYRNYASIEEFLPLAVLEYDKIAYPEAMRDYIFEKFKSCIFAYTSPSKTGAKFIFLIEKPNSIEEYKEYFFGIAAQLDVFEGLDLSNSNCTLPLFNSWDVDAKYREDAIPSTARGYKENAFDADSEIDFEIPENIDPVIEQKVIKVINRIFDKIEDNGHPQVVGSSFLTSGWCAANYIGEEVAFDTMNEAIERNDYLSKDTKGYLRTAKQMFIKGLDFPAEFKN